jgi:K+/H+ antiporter YhaU regulatory subunit KhtT
LSADDIHSTNAVQANEVLLRERMQNKYSVLEERKREAREQARLLEEEKKRAKAETALRKSLPGLYRQVARETGEYTNNVGETQLAVPRRLGGAQAMVVREEVTSEVARVQTVRAAQERLDEAVMNGVLPDEDTLRVAEEARRAAQRQSQRSAEKLRLEKALPSIARTLGETLGQAEPSAPGTQAGEEGEASEGMEVAQRRVGPEAEETYGGGGFKQKPRAAALDPAGRSTAALSRSSLSSLSLPPSLPLSCSESERFGC